MRIATPWHFGKALIQCYSSLMCLIRCEMSVDVLWMSRITFRFNFKLRISSFKTCTTDDSAPTPPRARVENSMPTLPKNVCGSPLFLALGRIWDKLCKLFEALRILATAIRIVDTPVSYPAHPRILSFHLKHMLKKKPPKKQLLLHNYEFAHWRTSKTRSRPLSLMTQLNAQFSQYKQSFQP